MMKQFACYLASVCLGAATLCAQQPAPLALEKTISLPGVTGKFDHFALDETGNRLFASAGGANAVVIIDLASDKIVEKLEGLGKPHGLAWIAETGRLFVTDGAKGELDVYAGVPLKRIQSIKLAEDADDVVYDAATKLLYVGFGGTNAANPARIAVVDTATLHLVSTLRVASHPEGLELDATTDRIFVNIADSGQVVVIDGKTREIAAIWSLRRCKDNTPLTFDADANLLLLGCRTPAQIVVLNGKTGIEGTTMSSNTGADDVFFEPTTRHAFLITGGGTVEIFSLSADGSLARLGATQTEHGAKTGYLDAKHRRLFVGVAGTASASSVRVYVTN
jgi:DNA-binding beta-propeller fold protein YncE